MSPDSDEPTVMISALQHWLFCKRQCALIHVEQAWSENRLTAAGRVLHERVDERKSESRRDIRLATAVRLVSRRLGVWGVSDMVEFHRAESEISQDGTKIAARLPGHSGFWRPFPVEYKRGRPKSHRADEVQLCAQALCLEEMLGVEVPEGALFYGETRRRMDVAFDDELHRLTHEAANGVRELIASGETPPPSFGKWCASCSLVDECRPKIVSSLRSARAWIDKEMTEALA